jgi:hypothetical protein
MRRYLGILGLALTIGACASPSLVPQEQAAAIRRREQSLAPHSAAIQETIRRSDRSGALAFFDLRDGHLVVLPGETPADAWARAIAAGAGGATDPVATPVVVTFVQRADLARAPEGVLAASLREEAALRVRLSGLDAELRTLTDAIAAARQEAQTSIDANRRETQKALDGLAEDVATARKFMLQVAQLGYLNQEMNAENAGVLKKAAAASQESAAGSAKVAESMRQLSDHLAAQLKELGARLDAIQNRINNIK